MTDQSEHISLRPDRYGPLSAGLMYERTAALLRGNGKLFFGIGLLVLAAELVGGGVFGLTAGWMRHLNPSAGPVGRVVFLVPLGLLCFGMIYVVTQIAHGAYFFAVRERLEGTPATVGNACGAAAARVGTLIAVSLLVALRIIGYVLAFYFVFAIIGGLIALAFGGMHLLAAFGPGHGPVTGLAAVFALLILAFVVLYVAVLFWLIIRYAVAIPAALAENLDASAAIRRSIELTRGAKGRLVALFAGLAAAWMLMIAITTPVQLMSTHTAHHAGAWGASAVALLLVAGFRMLVGWVLTVFLGVALVLCYYDLRVRKDGFGSASPVGGPVTGVPPMLPSLPVEDLPIS